MSVYRPILKRSIKFLWQKKFLWFFGIFASLLGNGGEINVLLNNFSRIEREGTFLDNLRNLLTSISFTNVAETLKGFFSLPGILLLLIFLVVMLALIYLTMVSQAAIITCAIEGEKSNANIREGFRRGKVCFVPVFTINLLVKIVTWGLLIVLSIPFLLLYLSLGGQRIFQDILIIISFLVLIPTTLVLSLLGKYAVIISLGEGKNIKDAVIGAWLLFKKHWIISLEMALLLFLINLAGALLLFLFFLFLSTPFILLFFIAIRIASSPLFWTTAITALFLAVGILMLFGSFLAVFQLSAWTFLVEDMRTKALFPKVLRLFARSRPTSI